MSNLLKLSVNCPVCHHSLMDERHRLSGEPSIRMVVENEGRKGWLRLSSLYGDYVIESEFTIPAESTARFYCPECGVQIKSGFFCDLCHSPLVPFELNGGGLINICSRRGCKRHFLEFDDQNVALGKLYDEFELGASVPLESPPVKPAAPFQPEVIEKGSYLAAYCPHCQRSMIDRNAITMIVERPDGEQGTLHLSPYLNVFTHQSSIEIPAGEVVKDLLCPHCRMSLIEEGRSCERCGSRIAGFTVTAMSKLISFYICLKKGCTWHGISEEDTQLIALEDSLEW